MNECEIELTVEDTIQVINPKEYVTYYTGSVEPSADLGEDGDIYLKV